MIIVTKAKILFCTLWCVLWMDINAQNHYALHYTTKDGLPSNKVYCCIQDAAGFMWFGTDNGLARFDGLHFKTYTVKDGLPDNDIFAVFEDRQQRLWILGFKQAPCYFYRDKLYTSANDSFLSKYFRDPDMFRYVVNRHEKRILFYVNYKGLFSVLEYGYIKPLPMNIKYIKGPVFALFSTNDTDHLFIPGEKINLTTNVWSQIPQNISVKDCDQVKYKSIDYGLGHDLHDNIILFRIIGDTIVHIKEISMPGLLGPYTNEYNQAVFISKDGDIFKYNPVKQTLDKEPYHIDGRPSTATIGKAGNQWICTHDNGFFILTPQSAEILNTGSDKGATSMLLTDKRNLVVSFENKSLHIYNGNREIQAIHLLAQNQVQTRITGIVYTGGYIYIGGDFYLERYNIENGNSDVFPGSSLNSTIKDLELSSNGDILIGSANGAAIFSPKSNRVKTQIWKTRTTAICASQGGDIYLGTVNGLSWCKAGSAEAVPYISNTGMDRARITDIRIDGKNRLWVGTAQYGLFIIDSHGVTSLSDEVGKSCFLTSYHIKHLFIDKHDIAWVSTDKGLNRVSIDPATSRCNVNRITTSFGLPDNNINASLVIGDTIYISSLSGVCRYYYNASSLSEVPGLEITETFVNNKLQFIPDGIELEHSQNNISIEFAAIAYKSARSIVFNYRLSGQGTQWITSDNNRVDLLSLEPGSYLFEVKAINTITGEASAIRHLAFTICRPWYLSWWFILVAGSLIVICAILAIRHRIYKVRQASELENQVGRQMAELEMQALRAQMNPHFIFNAMTAIQNYFVKNDEEKANAYMSRFARLIRQMLDYSAANFIPLEEEISLLENYMMLEKMRYEDKLDYALHIAPDIDTSDYHVPSMLIQPLLENAINHGIRPLSGKGLVNLSISRTGDSLKCDIIDNGIGINNSQKNKHDNLGHQSRGLEIVEKRIKSINQIYNTTLSMRVVDLSEYLVGQSGTLITIYFPLQLVNRPSINT